MQPSQMWENNWFKSLVRTPRSAWGNFRLTIHPYPSTQTHGRGGFFIHGGAVPGSAGCIDLTSNIDKFIEQLTKELEGQPECYIPLTVRYPQKLSSKIVALGYLLLAPVAAFAEVSDKEPTLLIVWALGAGAAAICFLAAYYKRWLGAILAVLPFLWFASFFVEIHSADVGPHLYAEQGLSYYVQSYLSLALIISGLILGLFMNKRRKNF